MKVNFSLTQIEYIVALNKFGHFAKAAEHCHITQPTLSMQIQKLEEALGVVLFDRTKKPILLTQAGKNLIEQFQSVLHEARKIEVIINTQSSLGVQGELNLAIIPTVAPYLLPRLLPKIEKLYPQINLTIFELETYKIIDALNNDEIDVGLLAIPLKAPKIIEQTLYFEPFYILCNKNHELSKNKKVSYDDLNEPDIWLLKEGHCLRNQVLDVCSLKEKILSQRKFKFESGSLETLKNLVNSYGGYTLLPELATDNLGENTKLIEFEKPTPVREIGLVYRREHYKQDLIEAIAETVKESIPKELMDVKKNKIEVTKPLSS